MVCVQLDETRYSVATRPLWPENLGKLLEVLNSRLSDCENRVLQPGNTDRVELFVEECLTELACKNRELLDNTEFDAPVFVLGKVSQTWNNRLLQVFDTNH